MQKDQLRSNGGETTGRGISTNPAYLHYISIRAFLFLRIYAHSLLCGSRGVYINTAWGARVRRFLSHRATLTPDTCLV